MTGQWLWQQEDGRCFGRDSQELFVAHTMPGTIAGSTALMEGWPGIAEASAEDLAEWRVSESGAELLAAAKIAAEDADSGFIEAQISAEVVKNSLYLWEVTATTKVLLFARSEAHAQELARAALTREPGHLVLTTRAPDATSADARNLTGQRWLEPADLVRIAEQARAGVADWTVFEAKALLRRLEVPCKTVAPNLMVVGTPATGRVAMRPAREGGVQLAAWPLTAAKGWQRCISEYEFLEALAAVGIMERREG